MLESVNEEMSIDNTDRILEKIHHELDKHNHK